MRPETSHSSQLLDYHFIIEECVLLVLRPDLFPLENCLLMMNPRCALGTPGGPALAEGPSQTLDRVQRNNPYLINSSGKKFKEFDYESKRCQGQGTSVFSLLVDANPKLQAVV